MQGKKTLTISFRNAEVKCFLQAQQLQAVSFPPAFFSYLQVLHSFLMQCHRSNLRGVLHMYTLLNHPSIT